MKSILIGTLAAILAAGAQSNEAERQLKAAMNAELVNGDLKTAIKRYGEIAAKYKSDRVVAGRALIRMADCYQKLGNSEARNIYERVLRDYGDQPDIAAQARERLALFSGSVLAKPGLTARRVWSGENIDDRLALSPDGRTVALVHSSGDIAVRDVASGGITRLGLKKSGGGLPEGARWPVFSPDQKQIAFEWWDASHTLRVAPVEPGANARILVRNPEIISFVPAAWSRDGKMILTAMWNKDLTWQLAWVSADDGSFRNLKSLEWRAPENVSLSPDGRYIAYDALERANGVDRDIFVLAADGSGEWPAVSGRGNDRGPVWTPDGKRLVFTSNRSGGVALYSIAVEAGKTDGAVIMLKSDLGRIYPRGFSPSGSLYYVQAVGDSNIFRAEVDLTTGKARGAASPVSDAWVGRNYSPAISPDGKWVAYLSNRKPVRYGPGEPTLVVRSLETDVEREFTIGLPIVGKPVWYANSRGLLIASLDPKLGSNLHRVDLESGRLSATARLESDVFPVGFALSPDGETIYAPVGLVGSANGGVDAIRLSTAERKKLARVDGVLGAALALSPDGRTLALLGMFASGGKPVSKLVFLDTGGMGAQTEFADQLPSGLKPNFGIAWSPDGRYVLFAREGTGQECELWRVPARGGAPEPAGLHAPMLRSMSVGPNGELTFAGGVPEQYELWVIENLLAVHKVAR